MSNLFYRPKPETATFVDVNKAIEEITKWDWTTGYSFAHIVIDDKNLSNKDILFCLQPSVIADVMNQRLIDKFGFEPKYLELEEWQQNIYEDEVIHMVEVIDLLNWLLSVPIEVRDEIE